jgi:hypothetical protein
VCKAATSGDPHMPSTVVRACMVQIAEWLHYTLDGNDRQTLESASVFIAVNFSRGA